jgi:hypothetical protein
LKHSVISAMRNFALALFVMSATILTLPRCGTADWINLTGAEVAPNIAEIYVRDDGVSVALEVYIGDLEVFSDLLPDDWYKNPSDITMPESARLARFGKSVLPIVADGNELPVKLVNIDRRTRKPRASPFAGTIDPYSGRRFPAPPEDKRVMYAELFYSFHSRRPQTIMLAPPKSNGGAVAASVGMIVFHEEVPVIDFRYLSAQAVLQLDWDDPWFSKFKNPTLIRHHRYPRMSFLYAEPYEIRHEALVRVRDAAELIGLTPAGEKLTGKESAKLSERAGALIAESSPMTVDGRSAVPDFDRAAYMRIGLRGLEILGPDEPIDVDADILGLIWSVPTDGLPKEATVRWTLFGDDDQPVPGYAIDAAGPFLFSLTPEDPILTWTNHFKKSPVPLVEDVASNAWSVLQIPVFSIVCWALALAAFLYGIAYPMRMRRLLGVSSAIILAVSGYFVIPFAQVAVPRPGILPAQMSPDDARNLTEKLLSNVYRSFDFKGERQVYDRLAKTVDGPLLEQVYLDQRRTLRVAKAGGAEARVKKVIVESAQPAHVDGTAADFVVRTKWTIVGTVGHWGHIHQRVNSYEAVLTISPQAGAWKILQFDVLRQERLS